ncbi:MAG: isocitrate/isopropylmalate family dehydrogenase, partial [Burkholderiales bacterium]
MTTYRIAVIPGDGIGKEVVPEGLRVLDAAARKFGFALALDHFDWSCENYPKHDYWMPPDWNDRI